MSLANQDIREMIAKKRLHHYEVAAALGIHPNSLSRWLAIEMKPEKKEQVKKAIQSIK